MEERKAFTVDMTPSWANVLPIYLEAYSNGSPGSRADAKTELERMARLADEYVAMTKAPA